MISGYLKKCCQTERVWSGGQNPESDGRAPVGMSSCKIITELLSNIIIYCIFSETLIRYEENKKDFMKFRQLGKK